MSRFAGVVPGWPLEEVRVSAAEALAPELGQWLHYRTDCKVEDGTVNCSHGVTAWTWSRGAERAVISWEWIELCQGVLVLADPNGLMSNILFVGDLQGMEWVEARNRNALILNTIVHGLQWQDRVLSEIRRQYGVGIAIADRC